MKYAVVTLPQLLVLSLLIAVLTAVLITLNSWFVLYTQLPVVHVDQAGACIKVENFVNGDAFNCADVGVLLRQYRNSAQ